MGGVMRTADARPTKEFFVENLTRDLSVEDAILDLLDNSIDSFVRSRNLEITAASLKTLQGPLTTSAEKLGMGSVSITFSKDEFRIEDDCGGITLEQAEHGVFRHGSTDLSHTGLLGIYGIGLKRAIFKIGKTIEIASMTPSGGFKTSIDVPTWIKKQDDWTFELEEVPVSQETTGRNGTSIRIAALTEDAEARAKDPTFLISVRQSISTSYALFLDKFVEVTLSGYPVPPLALPIGFSEELVPGFKRLSIDDVSAELLAGISADAESASANAGWYVICNGRVVLRANKAVETGWGISPMPQFHNKFNRFLGIALLFSQNPSRLPWSTTKRGINTDSYLYQTIRSEMGVLGRPVTGFLNKLYPSEPVESPMEREMVKGLTAQSLDDATQGTDRAFEPKGKKRKASEQTSVQYKVSKSDLAKAARALGNPSLPGKEVGERTFRYFLKHEVGE
jgi:hypothetical protein